MAWTDKMVEDLKLMWKQGLTTGEIGKRLGVSKNSIVGKVHRLELDARPSPIKKKEEIPLFKEDVVEKIEEKVEKKEPKKAIAPKNKNSREEDAMSSQKCEPRVNRAYSVQVKLTDLDNHTCRWPLGDPKDDNFRFCGKKVRVGQTYCEEHSAVAYVKPNAKK